VSNKLQSAVTNKYKFAILLKYTKKFEKYSYTGIVNYLNKVKLTTNLVLSKSAKIEILI
jgi:hypothetical protein